MIFFWIVITIFFLCVKYDLLFLSIRRYPRSGHNPHYSDISESNFMFLFELLKKYVKSECHKNNEILD